MRNNLVLTIFFILINLFSFGQNDILKRDGVIHLISKKILKPIQFKDNDYILTIGFTALFKGIDIPDLESKYSKIAQSKSEVNIEDIFNRTDTLYYKYRAQIFENIANEIINRNVTIYNWRYKRRVKKIIQYHWRIINLSTRFFFTDKRRNTIIFDKYEKAFIGVPSF